MAREREIQDHYFKQAKRDGYRSRAAYKLMELDDRRALLAKGDRVLDCGCAPGSWLQVAAERVGPRGRVVGIDLKALLTPLQLDNVTAFVGDLTTTTAEELQAGGSRFHVVLSDMAPNTTGDRTIDHHGSVRLCHAVLDRLPDVLRADGIVAMKVFEGTAYPELLARMQLSFEKVKGFKPKASRSISTEMYVIGHGFKPRIARGEIEAAPELAPPRKKPSTGWGNNG